MSATHFNGPVVSGNGFSGTVAGGNATGTFGAAIDYTTLTASTSLTVGSSGIAIKGIFSGTTSVTIAADAAAAEEDLSFNISGVAPGDLVVFSPLNASMETGVGAVAVWVSAAGTVKIRISNFKASGLTGSTQDWTYVWFDFT